LISRIIAPSVRSPDRAAVDPENLPGVRAPQPMGNEKFPDWRDAVALASFRCDAAPANGALQVVGSHAEHRAARSARPFRQRPHGDARMKKWPSSLQYATFLTKIH
jgi:hypothetical protein